MSVPLNIAEGKGRYHTKELLQFLYSARGSLYEVVNLLEMALHLKHISQHQHSQLRELAESILSKLSGLINSLK